MDDPAALFHRECERVRAAHDSASVFLRDCVCPLRVGRVVGEGEVRRVVDFKRAIWGHFHLQARRALRGRVLVREQRDLRGDLVVLYLHVPFLSAQERALPREVRPLRAVREREDLEREAALLGGRLERERHARSVRAYDAGREVALARRVMVEQRAVGKRGNGRQRVPRRACQPRHGRQRSASACTPPRVLAGDGLGYVVAGRHERRERDERGDGVSPFGSRVGLHSFASGGLSSAFHYTPFAPICKAEFRPQRRGGNSLPWARLRDSIRGLAFIKNICYNHSEARNMRSFSSL